MTDPMTDPKIIAELRELRRRTDINGITIPYGLLLSWNHLPSLLADSERLRLAVEGLEKIADRKEWLDGVRDIALDTLAKIKETT